MMNLDDTDSSSMKVILQMLYEEGQWDEISRLFLNCVSVSNQTNGSEDSKMNFDMEIISRKWKGVSQDRIWNLFENWRSMLNDTDHKFKQEELPGLLLMFMQENSTKGHATKDFIHDFSPHLFQDESHPKKQSEDYSDQIIKNLVNKHTNSVSSGPVKTKAHPLLESYKNDQETDDKLFNEEMLHMKSCEREAIYPTFAIIDPQQKLEDSVKPKKVESGKSYERKDESFGGHEPLSVYEDVNKVEPENPLNSVLKKGQEIKVDDVTKGITNAALWIRETVTENPLLRVDGEKAKSYELEELPSIGTKHISHVDEQDTGLSLSSEQIDEYLEKETRRKRTANETVLLTYTGTARRSTESVKHWTKKASHGVKDMATNSIKKLATQWEENKIGTKLIPNAEHREVCANVGKVGLAGIGATAIVAEAIFDGTMKVAEKGVAITADAVRDNCGESAGQAVEDTGKSITNVLQTVRLVSAFGATGMARSITRNTAKSYSIDHVSRPTLLDSKEDLEIDSDENTVCAENSECDSINNDTSSNTENTPLERKSDLDMLFESSMEFDSEGEDEDLQDNLLPCNSGQVGHLKQE